MLHPQSRSALDLIQLNRSSPLQANTLSESRQPLRNHGSWPPAQSFHAPVAPEQLFPVAIEDAARLAVAVDSTE